MVEEEKEEEEVKKKQTFSSARSGSSIVGAVGKSFPTPPLPKKKNPT